MSHVEDPDYRQIRSEFLAHVRAFHRLNGYSLNWLSLCEVLGVKVAIGHSNLHTTLKGLSLITYDPTAPLNRQLFTGLHEVCHELFSGSDECFRALLEDKYGADVAQALEEELCNEAASILLVPDHVLADAVTRHGYDPEAVFALSGRAGSLAACLMRVLRSQGMDAWGLILRRDGVIEFGCTTTRYPLRKDYRIEASHEIHGAWYGDIEEKASLPYASGSRAVKRTMRAASNYSRVVALFAPSFPPKVDAAQPTLFA
jgi:hypothetical protein